MTVPLFLRLASIAALIAFTARADAACLATGAMPTAQHAGDCADMPGGSDRAPTPERGQPSAAPCPFACVTLARVANSEVSVPPQDAIAATPTALTMMIGGRDPPPTPPPRKAA